MKVRKNLKDVVRYTSAQDPDLTKIRLNSAERNIPLPAKLYNDWLNRLKETDIRYYPDVQHAIDKLSEYEKVQNKYLTIGHGSDSIIKNIFECYTGPVVTTTPAFPMYNVYSKIFDVDITEVEYGKDYKFPTEKFLKKINPKTSIVILSNPCSPIGDSVSNYDLMRIISKADINNAIVVIDEAYIEFSNKPSFVYPALMYDNVIITKTFSKALGSAGVRFGYGIANENIINTINKVKNMYEITGPTLKWIDTVVDNSGYISLYTMKIKNNREKLVAKLIEKGYNVIKSDCNWVHTTKLDFDERFITKKCYLPHSEDEWTRLCVPADEKMISELI